MTSQIPASAVEMPGHQKQMGSLDVQFGNWESSAETSLFSFGSDSSVSKSMPSTLASRLIIKLCLCFHFYCFNAKELSCLKKMLKKTCISNKCISII